MDTTIYASRHPLTKGSIRVAIKDKVVLVDVEIKTSTKIAPNNQGVTEAPIPDRVTVLCLAAKLIPKNTLTLRHEFRLPPTDVQ